MERQPPNDASSGLFLFIQALDNIGPDKFYCWKGAKLFPEDGQKVYRYVSEISRNGQPWEERGGVNVLDYGKRFALTCPTNSRDSANRIVTILCAGNKTQNTAKEILSALQAVAKESDLQLNEEAAQAVEWLWSNDTNRKQRSESTVFKRFRDNWDKLFRQCCNQTKKLRGKDGPDEQKP